MREIASVENLEANAVDDFRVLFAGKLVIRHEAQKNCNQVFNGDQAEILSKCFRVEEVEETAQ